MSEDEEEEEWERHGAVSRTLFFSRQLSRSPRPFPEDEI